MYVCNAQNAGFGSHQDDGFLTPVISNILMMMLRFDMVIGTRMVFRLYVVMENHDDIFAETFLLMY